MMTCVRCFLCFGCVETQPPDLTMKSLLLMTFLTTLLGHANEHSVSIRAFALEEMEMPACFVAIGDNRFEQLKWPTRQPSPAIMVQAKGELPIYVREISPEGEPEFKLFRKVAIPEAADEVLLLGLGVGEDKQADILAIADNHKKAKFNDWLVINRSDLAVTFRFGEGNDPIQLAPGEVKPCQIQGERDKGGEVIAEAMKKGNMKKIYSTFWSASDKQRSIVLFYSKDDAVKVLRMIDFLNEDKEPKP